MRKKGDKYINIDHALELMGGHKVVLDKLVGMFLENNIIHNLDEEIYTDYEKARRKVHSCKGLSMNVGSEALYEIAYELEEAIINGEEEKEIEKLYKTFKKTYDKVKQKLKKYKTNG